MVLVVFSGSLTIEDAARRVYSVGCFYSDQVANICYIINSTRRQNRSPEVGSGVVKDFGSYIISELGSWLLNCDYLVECGLYSP